MSECRIRECRIHMKSVSKFKLTRWEAGPLKNESSQQPLSNHKVPGFPRSNIK